MLLIACPSRRATESTIIFPHASPEAGGPGGAAGYGGEKGFKEAAGAVKDPQLKSLFQEYSQQRHRFATELQSQAQGLGESEPEKTSSTAGAMHRAWINLKSAVTSGDDKAILSECERGEDSAAHAEPLRFSALASR